MTLSSLALTKTSIGGEGFFNRMCSINAQIPSFDNIRIVYFGTLGNELQAVKDNNEETKRRLSNRLNLTQSGYGALCVENSLPV